MKHEVQLFFGCLGSDGFLDPAGDFKHALGDLLDCYGHPGERFACRFDLLEGGAMFVCDFGELFRRVWRGFRVSFDDFLRS